MKGTENIIKSIRSNWMKKEMPNLNVIAVLLTHIETDKDTSNQNVTKTLLTINDLI